MNNAPPPPVPAVPGSHHQYGKPRGPPVGGPGPNRYTGSNQSGGYNPSRGGGSSNQGGNFNSGSYPPQGRAQPPYGGSNMQANGPRGPSSGYGVVPPSYPQSGQYGGSAPGGGRGGGNRNQQYGWQQ